MVIEYCKEYVDTHKDTNLKSNFSIQTEFEKLPVGHYIAYTCSGYGFNGILNDRGICKLIFMEPGITVRGEQFTKVKDIIQASEVEHYYQKQMINK